MELEHFLNTWPKVNIVMLGIGLVLLLGLADWWTGTEMALTIFYLLPIYVVTWFTGLHAGILVALLSAVVWLAADLLAGQAYSHPLTPFWNTAAQAGIFLIATGLLAELKLKREQHEQATHIDLLTKVANRRHFYQLAAMELARAHRHRQPLTIVYLNVDDFKGINERFGHHIGDLLLSMVASTIQRHLRRTDIVARIGNDEFAILMPETAQPAAEEVTTRLRAVLLDLMRAQRWPVTFSIGVLTFLTPPESVEMMVRSTDALIRSVRAGGRDMIRYTAVAPEPATQPSSPP
jgi:diguanylate cyclase (GGDEF)-like protein